MPTTGTWPTWTAAQSVGWRLADVVFLGRELLRKPCWPLEAALILNAEHAWSLQYERAKR